MDTAQGRVARWRLRLSEFRNEVCTRPGRKHHFADAMSRLPTLAQDRSVIPEEMTCLALADSRRCWVAPNYGEPNKKQPVTLARMLAAQKEDQRSPELRDRMYRNTPYDFRRPRRGSSCVLPPWTKLFKCTSRSYCARTSSRWNTTWCAPVILGSTGRTPPSGATATGRPWPRMSTTGWPVVRLAPGTEAHQGDARRCSSCSRRRTPSRACLWTSSDP